MFTGFKYLDKHSYHDMGITLAHDRSIGLPEKKKMKVAIPFSNVEYDFSEIYGSQTYSNRELVYAFNIAGRGIRTKSEMNSVKMKLTNWLMNSHGKQPLYDDHFPGYYFLAEVEDSLSFEENWRDGTLEVAFVAYPFMIAEQPEGNPIWDTFNFELDVFQPVSFDIDGTETVTLINAGTPDVFPTINASADMQIALNGRTYAVSAGKTPNADMPLVNGENYLSITGNGTIEFTFHKEMI